MTSNHGISSFSYNDFMDLVSNHTSTQTVQFYTKNDGLDSNGPTSTAKSLIDRYGRIWFTMVDGIAIYDPEKVHENSIMPLVQIETISVDNKIVLDNTLYTNDKIDITLKPGTKRVVLTFTGLSFDSPERITFTYKLTNFEDEFCVPTTVRSMSYTNLKPGKHIFYLNSINADGLYSKQAETVLLVQKPYLYQMPSFWVIVVFVLIGGIILIFYYNQVKMMKENLRLEKIVQERTAEVIQEKAKSDNLLRAILPNEIADELKDGIHSIGRDYDNVTILFSDIVEFTKTSSGHTASEIVDALNELFTKFDERAVKIGIEKIKTIGDAYMAACGVPTHHENHVSLMVEFAKGMLEDLAEYNKNAKIHFNIRIGLNCGPVTAGVIGKTKFIYDVWGNTVNVASRMETAANPGGIRVSEAVYEHLKDSDIKFSEPIECNIKGKGMMTTYNIL
jgi:class 3 adenylate cyclase